MKNVILLLSMGICGEIHHITTHAEYELQYKGAKEMLLVDDVDNKEFLAGLFNSMYDELSTPKPKKKK